MSDQLPVPTDEASPVLLVDDDATNLDVLRQALEGRGSGILAFRRLQPRYGSLRLSDPRFQDLLRRVGLAH